ncbi:ERV/ALR sulfhydryl oxidase domain-containing protein [Gongronella butleri]|nr:ERV/ALR sulfhydryl oxidase domain-containing protein [Gongronella butleri]
MSRRVVWLVSLATSLVLSTVYILHLSQQPPLLADSSPAWYNTDSVSDNIVYGGVIMDSLGNDTIKEELGRSTWKLLHTMTARFPEEPRAEERSALTQFILLLSRLYPCGECAEHFQVLIKEFPPQTSSRATASQWACAVHNKVNERLRKPIFDCSNIEVQYPCGCSETTE